MYSYEFKQIKNSNLDEIYQKDAILWISHADKIPPHIGISMNGNYYSWKAKGLDFEIDVAVVQKSIDLLQLPSIQIVLNFRLSEDRLKSIFLEMENLKNVNCYSPIKKAFELGEDIPFIYSMLAYLEEQGSILDIFGQYLPENYRGLLHYSQKEIDNRITNLRNQ
jgi:hypothetical protein